MSGYMAALSSAQVLTELAAEDPRVVLVSQDFGPIGEFTRRFPERHFDVGISEENLVGVAAGLAHAGKVAFAIAMAPFVSMRGFEQIRDDCAYNRNNVKIIAPFAGLEAVKDSPLYGTILGTGIALVFALILGVGATLAEIFARQITY